MSRSLVEPPRKTLSRRQCLLALGHAAAWPALMIATRAQACEFFATTLRVTHPWTRVTPQSSPFAIVCMRIDQVTHDDRLIGVQTPVAMRAEVVGLPADLHGGQSSVAGVSLPIARGQQLELGEQGVQLRLIGLTQPLLMARTYPMTLVFERGGELQAELNVDYEAA